MSYHCSTELIRAHKKARPNFENLGSIDLAQTLGLLTSSLTSCSDPALLLSCLNLSSRVRA